MRTSVIQSHLRSNYIHFIAKKDLQIISHFLSAMAANHHLTEAEIAHAHATLYAAGLEVRTAVAGPEYAERSLAAHSSPFSRPMQELATEAG